MTKQVQRRRGTATQHTSFTGAEGELSVNTTNKSVHVHDNVTAGGFEAARADMDNVTSSSILTAAGITATTAELNYVDGVTSNIQTQLDSKAGTASPTFTGTLTTANLTATGTTTLAGASTSADITFGDNDKAIFGAGSDLQIYHTATGDHSVINESGGGDLQIQANKTVIQSASGADDFLVVTPSAGVQLSHNASGTVGVKLATTSTGVDITGTLTSDGLTVDGKVLINTPASAIAQEIRGRSSNDVGYLQFSNNAGTTSSYIGSNGSYLNFEVGSAERMRIDSSGNVGIGTSSPTGALHVSRSGLEAGITLERTTSATAKFTMAANDGNLVFTDQNQSAERMRIDSSGNLLVGKTSADFGATAGVEFRGDGRIATGRAGESAIFNRLTTDGDIALFRKDGTTVGSIGSNAGAHLTMGSGDTGLLFNASTDKIHPWNMSTQGVRDNAVDLGVDVSRFKDLYLSGGVYLGGTGAANYLNDVEYGTYSLADASSASLTLTVRYAVYKKVGQLVHVEFDIDYPSNTNGQNAQLTIPFTPNVTYFSGIVGWSNNAVPIKIHGASSGAYLMDCGSPGAGNIHLTNANLSATRIIGSFYFSAT